MDAAVLVSQTRRRGETNPRDERVAIIFSVLGALGVALSTLIDNTDKVVADDVGEMML